VSAQDRLRPLAGHPAGCSSAINYVYTRCARVDLRHLGTASKSRAPKLWFHPMLAAASACDDTNLRRTVGPTHARRRPSIRDEGRSVRSACCYAHHRGLAMTFRWPSLTLAPDVSPQLSNVLWAEALRRRQPGRAWHGGTGELPSPASAEPTRHRARTIPRPRSARVERSNRKAVFLFTVPRSKPSIRGLRHWIHRDGRNGWTRAGGNLRVRPHATLGLRASSRGSAMTSRELMPAHPMEPMPGCWLSAGLQLPFAPKFHLPYASFSARPEPMSTSGSPMFWARARQLVVRRNGYRVNATAPIASSWTHTSRPRTSCSSVRHARSTDHSAVQFRRVQITGTRLVVGVPEPGFDEIYCSTRTSSSAAVATHSSRAPARDVWKRRRKHGAWTRSASA